MATRIDLEWHALCFEPDYTGVSRTYQLTAYQPAPPYGRRVFHLDAARAEQELRARCDRVQQGYPQLSASEATMVDLDEWALELVVASRESPIPADSGRYTLVAPIRGTLP